MSLTSFELAQQIIHDHTYDIGTEKIPLHIAIGRVSREPLIADRSLPPYDRVTMDGIAIKYESAIELEKLPIKGVIAAGDPKSELSDPNSCVEIMTGAVLPVGADTIIRYEDVDIKDGWAVINAEYTLGQNIHYKGEDRSEGDIVVPEGTKLSAAEIGVGASIGKKEILVSRLPAIMIISTGDELVEIDQTPLPHQIRRSNVYRIQASLKAQGIPVDTDHLPDDHTVIKSKVNGYLQSYDTIILSGGVSKGKFDHIPNVLEALGVKKHFHRIAQRPGKPMWFGTHANGCTVFALPGNPVSSFMCMQVYVMNWLDRIQGVERSMPLAILADDVHFKPDLTYFLEVKLEHGSEGKLIAHPRKGHGSGDLANLVRGDAFICLPRGRNDFKSGEIYPVYRYR